MKTVILGNGLLGSEIAKQTGWAVISRSKDGVDFRQILEWSSEMLSEFDVVVNCMAYTNTYSNEDKLSWDINVKALDELCYYCEKTKKKLIHISTDYVYANSVENADETDVPVHVGTWYGYTKLVGEAIIKLRMKNYLVCRLSHKPCPFPYDKAWDDMRTNGDYVNVIASLVIELVKKDAVGLFNVGTEEKTIYDLALQTKEVDPCKKPENVPGNTTMSVEKMKNFLSTSNTQ
jgi:dTDP-4-dehydrorhamnose reductase